MKILGIIFCMISILVTYKKLILILFGKNSKGIIIGYGNGIKSTKGMIAYPYIVKYEYNNQNYIATALESDSGNYAGVFSKKNLNREVNISFKLNNPNVVTIKDFKNLYFISFFIFLAGSLLVII